MLFLFDAFGLAGILLAPPVGIVAQILFRYLLRFRRESLLQGADQQESDPQVFMERLQDLRARFQHATMEESLPDALVNLYGRLEKLGEKTTYILDEQRTGSGAEHV